ncbi:MAG: LLM class flavin-dependent oxidoreductase [bacterium]|nr:LLM class flavin-dependent oxidoreductase [Deltaproteobacteria bacterium]MCP4905373.1 LLM class flavin-dependent oxidoreductase [bacterium]
MPPRECVAELLRQASLAEEAGFDGLMTSEHHGGFPGYVPNPLQLAGWLLEATDCVWAAPCPLLLPLYHWSHITEQLAWLAVRFPGRVGGGFAIGGLAQDFEMADLVYEDRVARFKHDLPLVTEALRGRAASPLAEDPAVAACRADPVPMVSAAQSPGAVRRAARVGIGVLYDSLQTLARMREISDAYSEAGGQGTRIAIRRVWIGPPLDAQVEAQMDFYRGYATSDAQAHWGAGEELVSGVDGAEVAEKLLEVAGRGGCDSFNLRVHAAGIDPVRVEEQIARLGAETLPMLVAELRGG